MHDTVLSPMSEQWQGWISENIARGCSVGDMVNSMVQAGVAENVARDAIVSSQRLPEARLPTLVYPSCNLDLGNRRVQVLATLRRPNVAVLGDFLDEAECDMITALSLPKLVPSKVVSNADGSEALDPVRTSYGTYFARGSIDELRPIEERIACLTGMPVDHGEGLQVLRYSIGARYVPHYDFFPPEVNGSQVHLTPKRGGQRVATIVIYLNTVSLGGETEFPEVGCKVAAVKGNACFFSYMNDQGQLDRNSLHSGNPVEAGEKWIATWWMRQGRC